MMTSQVTQDKVLASSAALAHSSCRPTCPKSRSCDCAKSLARIRVMAGWRHGTVRPRAEEIRRTESTRPHFRNRTPAMLLVRYQPASALPPPATGRQVHLRRSAGRRRPAPAAPSRASCPSSCQPARISVGTALTGGRPGWGWRLSTNDVAGMSSPAWRLRPRGGCGRRGRTIPGTGRTARHGHPRGPRPRHRLAVGLGRQHCRTHLASGGTEGMRATACAPLCSPRPYAGPVRLAAPA
jgi:hypothetical protein